MTRDNQTHRNATRPTSRTTAATEPGPGSANFPTSATPPANTATRSPLISRDFILLVAGQGISLFGNMMLRFAMSMWVLDETGSAAVFASILAVSIVRRFCSRRSAAYSPTG